MTNQLSHGNLLPDLSKVTLRRVFKTDQGWIMEAHGQNSAICPGCQRISRSRHSWYWRSLRDLPVQGTQVILRLHLGRWRCRNAVCERRIFTEPLSKVCAPYAQQTKRTGEIIAAVGRALGGRPGQRLMRRLGIQVSADTLIRQVKRAARLPALPQLIRVLGVDDWAWCKGQTFGTILVDLERRQVVDLLPTRSADSLGEWLAQHPEVTTISRDRQGVYAEGARRGAPEAVQVADRFHLVLNLTQAVERELAVNRRQLRIASPSAPALPSSPTRGSEESNQADPSQIQHRDAANGSCPAATAAETGAISDDQANEGRWHEGESNRQATWPMSTTHRQMDPARRAVGKKPDAAAPGMPESFRDYLRQR